MGEDSVLLSIRLPVKLVERIDENIARRGHFTTKPAYILYAMEKAFNAQVSARINIQTDIDEFKNKHNKDPTEELLSSVRKKLTEECEQYDGEKIQILLRVPKRLMADIDESLSVIGFYSNKIDYIKVALINQLEADEISDKRLEIIKRLEKESKEKRNDFIESIISKVLDASKNYE